MGFDRRDDCYCGNDYSRSGFFGEDYEWIIWIVLILIILYLFIV